MPVKPLSISVSVHILIRNHVLPARVANLSELVAADDQRVSKCKWPCFAWYLPSIMHYGYQTWRQEKELQMY
jgi:hypothetical protein